LFSSVSADTWANTLTAPPMHERSTILTSACIVHDSEANQDSIISLIAAGLKQCLRDVEISFLHKKAGLLPGFPGVPKEIADQLF
jgi:hypothetical protein